MALLHLGSVAYSPFVHPHTLAIAPHSLAIAQTKQVIYDPRRKSHRQDGTACFEGERVTPTQGEDYATHAPFAPLCLCSRSSRNPAFSADRFSDSVFFSAEHEFNRHREHWTEHRQGKLLQQRHVCEQQRADCSETGELFRATTRSHRTMSRWKLQFQPKPTRHLFASRWGLQMALDIPNRSTEIR